MLTSKFAKLSKRKGAKNAFLVGLYNELTGGGGGSADMSKAYWAYLWPWRGKQGAQKDHNNGKFQNWTIGGLCSHIYDAKMMQNNSF